MDRVWMDSGAFSAFTLGSTIDMLEYCRWCDRWREVMDYYAVLDVIGSAEGTYQNQKKMEAAGVRPVPCFHYGEDPAWLERYMAEGYSYIALGGMVPIESDQLLTWLDDVWEHYLCNPDGTPKIKVHGFGLTTFDLVARYPWFSVDSSSWLATGSFGSIMFWMDGKLHRMVVSDDSPKSAQYGAHFKTFPQATQRRIRDVLERDYNTTIEAVSGHYKPRHVVNRQTYYMAETLGWQPAPYKAEPRLFSSHPPPTPGPVAEGWPWPRCQIYLAGSVTAAIEEEMWRTDPPVRRMFSFHAIRKQAKHWALVQRYIEDLKGA